MKWMKRLGIACALALLGWALWLRWEARIATTAIPAPLGAAKTEERAHRAQQEQDVNVEPLVGRDVRRSPSGTQSKIGDQKSKILSVPFVSQAPFRVWDLPYKEYCEEASVLTLHYWKSGVPTPPADQLDRDLKEVQAWEEENLRTWDDTTAEETARILRQRFGYTNTSVVRDVSPSDIKRELDAGRPVIVPARGRELDSPYFTPPGPLYHMLVIIGYDDAAGQWVTNDVGTNTKGAGQRYAYDDLFNAMGDWSHDQQQPTNEKVMVVVE